MKLIEMEDDVKKIKKPGGLFRRVFGGSTWSLSLSSQQSSPTPHERRALKSTPEQSSHFRFESEHLAKQYVEKEVKYIGTITDMSISFNPENRTEMLSLLDERLRLGLLSLNLNWKHDVIMSFSVYNIKILWRDGEELVHRIPINQVESIGYVNDDDKVIVFVKFVSVANENICSLALFLCDNVTAAQEICHLNQQLFQLAYTNSTLDFFDKSIRDGAVTPNYHSFSTEGSSDRRVPVYPFRRSQKSRNVSEFHRSSSNRGGTKTGSNSSSSFRRGTNSLGNGDVMSFISNSTRSSSSSRRAQRSGSSSGSTSTHNTPRQHIELHEYIQVLRERLTTDELRRFAEHLHCFRTGTVPINTFCENLLEIYTEQRKTLLLGMRHFIPDSDQTFFENFLQLHGVDSAGSNVTWWRQPTFSRSTSETENGSPALAQTPDSSDHTSFLSTSNSEEMNSLTEKWENTDLEDQSSTLTREHFKTLPTDPDFGSQVVPSVLNSEDTVNCDSITTSTTVKNAATVREETSQAVSTGESKRE